MTLRDPGARLAESMAERQSLRGTGSERKRGGDARWQAVLARDPAFDGAFVYAVTSTGIYCRPTCPSRRPARDRVRFLASATEAAAAGYRACRRCHPDRGPAGDPTLRAVVDACRAIEEASGTPPSLAQLARRVGLGPHHLQRSFRRRVGVTPRQYADARRVERLRAGLRDGAGVARAQYAAGYGSSSRLYASAPHTLGMTPAVYARGGAGERIRYAVVRSALGALLVAATERGICRVALGTDAATLRRELAGEFHAARLERADASLRRWIESIAVALEGKAPLPGLPIDVRATAFERKVFEALRAIPTGATTTYAELARTIGHPGAARAVGSACARNPVPLVIPCHRVVRADGAAGGYRFGESRKRALLDLERPGR